jgi:hypothetical protein
VKTPTPEELARISECLAYEPETGITDDQITELWMDSALCKDRHIGFGLMIAGEVMAQLRARGLVKNASERTVSGTGKSRER